MAVRIARIIGIVFLCSICFFPLLRFVAPLLSNSSLTFYLWMSLFHSIFMISVAWFINQSAGRSLPFSKSNNSIGLFLFLSGVFFVIAFGMGKPPRDANEWITNRTLEVWRGIFLELAVICTGLGLYFFSRFISHNFSKAFGAIFLILTVIGVGLTIYDFYWGLVLIPHDIDTWAKEGKDLNQFFSQYDMKNELRGSARCLIYLFSILTFFIGWKLHIIKTWLAVVLALLCIFLFQDVFVPLISDISQINVHIGMVPAVALSPLYLLGVYLIAEYVNKKSSA